MALNEGFKCCFLTVFSQFFALFKKRCDLGKKKRGGSGEQGPPAAGRCLQEPKMFEQDHVFVKIKKSSFRHKTPLYSSYREKKTTFSIQSIKPDPMIWI